MAEATVYTIPKPGTDSIVGEDQTVVTVYEDTLYDLARKFSLGSEELIRVNPGVDPWLPGAGKTLVVPNKHILPPGPREGIVVNLPEHRLYYYPKPNRDGSRQVITYPVSIGKMDWRTPLGLTHVIQKQKNPVWYPPESVRKEHAAAGDPLPASVPSGPDNPLGLFAMRLAAGNGTYLIHGTNNPMAVGMAITHGCVRMYPEDVAALFPLIPVGTKVWLVNDPVKVAFSDGELFMEVHPQVDDEGQNTATDPDLELLSSNLDEALGATTAAIHWDFAKQALEAANGIPTVVGLQADMDPAAAEAAIKAEDQDKDKAATGGTPAAGSAAVSDSSNDTPIPTGMPPPADAAAAPTASPAAKSDGTVAPQTHESQAPEPPVTTLRPVKAPAPDAPAAASPPSPPVPLAEAGPQRP